MPDPEEFDDDLWEYDLDEEDYPENEEKDESEVEDWDYSLQ